MEVERTPLDLVERFVLRSCRRASAAFHHARLVHPRRSASSQRDETHPIDPPRSPTSHGGTRLALRREDAPRIARAHCRVSSLHACMASREETPWGVGWDGGGWEATEK